MAEEGEVVMPRMTVQGLAKGLGVVLAAVAVAFGAACDRESGWFVEVESPVQKPYRLFDIGVTDVDEDGNLDIYTSNHHFRQQLLLGDGKGGFHDALSELGLDQSLEFPRAELSLVAPEKDRPGLYIYWYSTKLVIETVADGSGREWRGRMSVNNAVRVFKNVGFEVEKIDQASPVSPTVIRFAAAGSGRLLLKPNGQGLPIRFELEAGAPLDHVYVGAGKVSPKSSVFSLAMQDRHGHAWADYNGDGRRDVFINRGALGGMLRAYPPEVQAGVKDEFLVSTAEGRYREVGEQVGIRKNGCSGRHARWLDFNADGLLDLYQNCVDRGHVEGAYPKQLYLQEGRGRLRDVAADVGADMPEQQLGHLLWADVDGDGDPDLVTFQDEGVFLYRNRDGRLARERLYRQEPAHERTIGASRGEGDAWLFDGKLGVADYDGDGDLDLFCASKYGNRFFVNDRGTFSYVDPASMGLPKASITADWVDYDNDGRPDLHLVPQGLFRQRQDRSFEATGMFRLVPDQYEAAICNWFDYDNDGRRDLLMTLSTNRRFKHWWEFNKKPLPISDWNVKLYRNVGAKGHWLEVVLEGGRGNREGIGAQVAVVTGERRQLQEVGATDGAFFSQGHYRLYFGLGSHKGADAIRVRWSDGSRQELKAVAGDRIVTIRKRADGGGAGRAGPGGGDAAG